MNLPTSESENVVATSVLAAIVYGILHDLVTAHVCVEYFTIGHPRIIESENPVLLALVWGVLATWWVGLILGGILALASQAGIRPPYPSAQIRRPIAGVMLCTAVTAVVCGTAGWIAATAGYLKLTGSIGARVPPYRHAAFLADLCAHTASYFFGAIGGLTLSLLIFKRRRPLHSEADRLAAAVDVLKP